MRSLGPVQLVRAERDRRGLALGEAPILSWDSNTPAGTISSLQ